MLSARLLALGSAAPCGRVERPVRRRQRCRSATNPHMLAVLVQAGQRNAQAVKLVGNVTTTAATHPTSVTRLTGDGAALRTQVPCLPAEAAMTAAQPP